MNGRTWFALAVVVVLAVLTGFVRDFSGDFHWHIVLGGDMLDTGSLYTHDRHSHTFFGKEFMISAWLSDVLYAAGYRAAGYPGCYLVRAIALVIMSVCLFNDSWKRGAGTAGALALTVGLLSANFFRFFLRPETLALSLFAALLALLGAHQRSSRPFALAVATVLPLLWVNLHGSVSIGLFALGLYCAQRVISEFASAERPKNLRLILSCLAAPPVAFALSCVNPEGISAPLVARVVSPVWAAAVYEWMPLPLGSVPPLVMLFAAAALLSTVLSLTLSRRISPWLVVLSAALVFFALRHRRFLSLTLVSFVPLIADNIGNLARAPLMMKRSLFWQRIGRGVAAAALALSAIVLFADHRLQEQVGLTLDAGSMPEGACAFLKKETPPGRLFNTYVDGSYLMHCLGPDYPVFIDPRYGSLYSDSFFQRYMEAVSSPAAFHKLLADYPIRWAVVRFDAFAAQLMANPAFRLIYFDDQTMVFASVADSATGAVIAKHGFRWLVPARLPGLLHVPANEQPSATAELARQRQTCPNCVRTHIAAAALAVAQGDDRAFLAARDAILRTGEPPELPFIAATHAFKKKDWLTAAGLFAHWRELGGDPLVATVEQARSVAMAGDRRQAEQLLEPIRGMPGGAPIVDRLRSEILGEPAQEKPAP